MQACFGVACFEKNKSLCGGQLCYLKNAAFAGLKAGHFCGPQTEVLPTVGNKKRAQKSGAKLEPETVPVCCSF